MSEPSDKPPVGQVPAREVRKSLANMTIDELREFVAQHGSDIQIEVASTESFNVKFASPPQTKK
jgi:hypothetical protein